MILTLLFAMLLLLATFGMIGIARGVIPVERTRGLWPLPGALEAGPQEPAVTSRDLEAAESRINLLEERLDFAEQLMAGRPSGFDRAEEKS